MGAAFLCRSSITAAISCTICDDSLVIVAVEGGDRRGRDRLNCVWLGRDRRSHDWWSRERRFYSCWGLFTQGFCWKLSRSGCWGSCWNLDRGVVFKGLRLLPEGHRHLASGFALTAFYIIGKLKCFVSNV
jgi:hypothetical protein